jgi:hypothetical protein
LTTQALLTLSKVIFRATTLAKTKETRKRNKINMIFKQTEEEKREIYYPNEILCEIATSYEILN